MFNSSSRMTGSSVCSLLFYRIFRAVEDLGLLVSNCHLTSNGGNWVCSLNSSTAIHPIADEAECELQFSGNFKHHFSTSLDVKKKVQRHYGTATPHSHSAISFFPLSSLSLPPSPYHTSMICLLAPYIINSSLTDHPQHSDKQLVVYSSI